ncbi:hypothetical protein BD770DRAFT_409640 [Pilaira anomala]|nr:hypothetical protein BD770DRAFT_409640 [Pilaira anomala]
MNALIRSLVECTDEDFFFKSGKPASVRSNLKIGFFSKEAIERDSNYGMLGIHVVKEKLIHIRFSKKCGRLFYSYKTYKKKKSWKRKREDNIFNDKHRRVAPTHSPSLIPIEYSRPMH